MSPEYEKKILEDLEKTGFPSEYTVRRVLHEHGARWDSTNTMGFFDLDENKLREIDLYAFMPCGDRVSSGKSTHTVWSLAIEVKRSESNPWIVFSERRDVIRDVLLWEKDLVSYCNLPAPWPQNFSWVVYENSFCRDQKWIGTGIHEGFRKPGGTEYSRPHGALISSIKAAEHFHLQAQASMGSKEVVKDISTTPSRMHFIRPVVVIDGDLVLAEMDESGKMKVKELKFAPMSVSYRSQAYGREKYRVDLVHIAAFDEYLTACEAQHDAVRKAILRKGGLQILSDAEVARGEIPKRLVADGGDALPT